MQMRNDLQSAELLVFNWSCLITDSEAFIASHRWSRMRAPRIQSINTDTNYTFASTAAAYKNCKVKSISTRISTDSSSS
jgi:hypothetical protein